MSGSGRRSQYRKSVTAKYNNSSNDSEISSLLTDNLLAKVLENRGGGHFLIQVVDKIIEEEQIAKLPNKFHKLIWIKRNDFVIVSSEGNGIDKVQYEVVHVLSQDNIKTLKSQCLWPESLMTVLNSDLNGGGYSNDEIMPIINDYEDNEDSYYNNYDDDNENNNYDIKEENNSNEEKIGTKL